MEFAALVRRPVIAATVGARVLPEEKRILSAAGGNVIRVLCDEVRPRRLLPVRGTCP
jgi:hypothetical protein